MSDNPIEAYRNRLLRLTDTVDELARQLTDLRPYDAMQQYAAQLGLDEQATDALADPIADDARHIRHCINEVQRHLTAATRHTGNYLARATERRNQRP